MNIQISNRNNNYNLYSQKKPNCLKKILPYVFGGMLATGGVGTCADSFLRYSGTETGNGLNVEYTDVTKVTKDSVMKPVYELKSVLKPENDFLDGVKFDIVKSFKDLESVNSFNDYVKKYESGNTYKGTSFYSDSALQKHVAVQEAGFKYGKVPVYKQMRQTVMHEVGHHFDNYFGHRHDDKIARRWESILNEHEKKKDLFTFFTTSKEDRLIEKKYYLNNGLSDNEEFKKALKKDIIGIYTQRELPENIECYVSKYQMKNCMYPEKINISDFQRSEIYANLFSYLSGQDDGDCEKFLKTFSNSSKVVKRDMVKYLKLLK